MANPGVKPQAVGDRGQRFEVRSTGWPRAEMTVVGRCNSRDEAEQWARGILSAPGCLMAEFEDREEKTVTSVE